MKVPVPENERSIDRSMSSTHSLHTHIPVETSLPFSLSACSFFHAKARSARPTQKSPLLLAKGNKSKLLISFDRRVQVHLYYRFSR